MDAIWIGAFALLAYPIVWVNWRTMTGQSKVIPKHLVGPLSAVAMGAVLSALWYFALHAGWQACIPMTLCAAYAALIYVVKYY
jgi:hypothetical protein